MTFVVDASVAVKWFVREDLHDQAKTLLFSEDVLLAPDLIVAEVTNTVWKKTTRGQIDRAQAAIIAAAILQGEPRLYPSTEFHERALETALALNHPVYDCLYLACAERFDAVLVTADTRFCRTLRDGGFADAVVHLNDM